MDLGPVIAVGAIGVVGAAGYGISTIPGTQEAGEPDRFSQRNLGSLLAGVGILGGAGLITRGRSLASDELGTVIAAQVGALGVVAGVGAGIGVLTDRAPSS